MDYEPLYSESRAQALASFQAAYSRPIASPQASAPLYGLGNPYGATYFGQENATASRSVSASRPPAATPVAAPMAPAAAPVAATSLAPASATSNRPLKLAHVGPCFMCGGVEQHTLSLAKFMNPRRVQFVKCLVTNPKLLSQESAAWMPVPVEYCDPANVSRAVADCDVVLLWGDGFNEILKPSRPQLSIFVAHGESWWTRQTIDQSLRVIDHVVAVSQRVQDRVCSGVPSTMILNGVDAARLSQTRPRDAVRSRLGFSPTDYVLGSVGRFSNEKRMPLLIDAMTRLPAHFKLLLVGHGARRHELLDLANDLIPGRYAIATADNYLGDFYRAMDAFALVSEHEGFGLVIPEAMLCERPVIVTDVGCVPEIIRDRVNGLVVNPTPQQIADAVRMLQEHPEWAKGLAAEGRAVADARLHAARMAREYEDLLWQLWQAKSPAKLGSAS